MNCQTSNRSGQPAPGGAPQTGPAETMRVRCLQQPEARVLRLQGHTWKTRLQSSANITPEPTCLRDISWDMSLVTCRQTPHRRDIVPTRTPMHTSRRNSGISKPCCPNTETIARIATGLLRRSKSIKRTESSRKCVKNWRSNNNSSNSFGVKASLTVSSL